MPRHKSKGPQRRRRASGPEGEAESATPRITTNNGIDRFSRLPPELHLSVASYLSFRDCASLQRCCRTLHNAFHGLPIRTYIQSTRTRPPPYPRPLRHPDSPLTWLHAIITRRGKKRDAAFEAARQYLLAGGGDIRWAYSRNFSNELSAELAAMFRTLDRTRPTWKVCIEYVELVASAATPDVLARVDWDRLLLGVTYRIDFFPGTTVHLVRALHQAAGGEPFFPLPALEPGIPGPSPLANVIVAMCKRSFRSGFPPAIMEVIRYFVNHDAFVGRTTVSYGLPLPYKCHLWRTRTDLDSAGQLICAYDKATHLMRYGRGQGECVDNDFLNLLRDVCRQQDIQDLSGDDRRSRRASAMQFAVAHGLDCAIRLLVEEGAEPDSEGVDQRSALYTVPFTTINFLISEGASLGRTDPHPYGHGLTFLHHVLALAVPRPSKMPPFSWYVRKHFGMRYHLPVQPADLELCSLVRWILSDRAFQKSWAYSQHEDTGLAPLHLALLAQPINAELIRELLEAGAHRSCNQALNARVLLPTKTPPEWLHTERSWGSLPLHMAICLKSSTQQIVDLLLQYGADPAVKDGPYTAMTFKSSAQEIMELDAVLQDGAGPIYDGADGVTAYELNRRLGNRFVLP